MTKQEITHYLEQVNETLKSIDIKGEICLYGGAVMCLVYNARPTTKDVDAIFEPTQKFREVIKKVAQANNLNDDWLNDSVKGFVVNHKQQIFFNWSHLKIYIPEPDYLLAMKTLAARVDTLDNHDIQFLIHKMNIKNAESVFNILEKYYPKQQIKPATQFFIEELFTK
ncbi:MAG: hypothetical protein KAH77_05095 [Thiomargarita sp.]|nr:hypothetical protein [Thiomargarita sp.]